MNAIVAFALRQRVLIVVLLVAVLGTGIASFLSLNIEAYPDPVPPLVDVVTQSTGQSAEEIERYITIPLEIQMAGIPNVQAIRTISLFGLSDVKVQFTYDFTYQQAEQWVTNRLSQLGSLPNDLADSIARYLVAAGTAEDPEQAYAFTKAANRLAARVGIVREASGIAADRIAMVNAKLNVLPDVSNVVLMPEATPRRCGGTEFMIDERFGDA